MVIKKTMLALQWQGNSLALNHVPMPGAAEGEAIVRVARAGICNTDLEIMRGYYPFEGTLGHEFVGRVEWAEDSSLIGKRVVADINIACGQCETCRSGQPHHCRERKVLGIRGANGAFAEYLRVPAPNLVLVPDALDDTRAAFAEPLAAALEIQEQVLLAPGQEVAVVGDGKLGLLIGMSLGAAGMAVSMIGRHPERATLANLAAAAFYPDLPERTFPVVIEATGSPDGFHDALSLTAPRGTLVLKSTYAAPLTFNPAPLVVNEITLLGSRCGPMSKAIDLLASGAVDPVTLVDDISDLSDGQTAMVKAAEKGRLKCQLRM